MPSRHQDWSNQAQRDLDAARNSLAQVINGNALPLEICHDGWILVGQPAYLHQVKETFAEVRHRYGLEKTKTGWVLQNPG